MNESRETHPWRRYEPSRRRPWNLSRAVHLWRRAGFGASFDQLKESLKAGPQKTVDLLLEPKTDAASFNRTCDEFVQDLDSAVALRPWRLRRMILTPHPLLEKMTLFWQGFFAVSADRGPNGRQMRRHAALLRNNALGSFPKLIAEVCTDVAVLLAMETATYGKTVPGENFARQLLGRYTVGVGNFSKQDLRQSVRAMSGWCVLRHKRRYFENRHVSGAKTILGKTGNFDYDDAVRIASKHPATAANIVRRLYRLFISETQTPGPALIAPLIEAFARDFNIAGLVETMLRSNLFFSDASIGRRIKSPVEFAVGILRSLEANVPTARLADDLAALGENLYHPPTPDGWAGGQCWINQATVTARYNLAAALLDAAGPYGGKCDPAALARRRGLTGANSAARFLAEVLSAPGDTIEQSMKLLPPRGKLHDRLRKLAYGLIARPEFQLA